MSDRSLILDNVSLSSLQFPFLLLVLPHVILKNKKGAFAQFKKLTFKDIIIHKIFDCLIFESLSKIDGEIYVSELWYDQQNEPFATKDYL